MQRGTRQRGSRGRPGPLRRAAVRLRLAIAAASDPITSSGNRATTAATGSENRVKVGPSSSGAGRRTSHRAPRSTSRRAARNIRYCAAAGTRRSRSSIADHVSRDREDVAGGDVGAGEHGEARAGLVGEAREEADPGPVDHGVGDDGRGDLTVQRVRVDPVAEAVAQRRREVVVEIRPQVRVVGDVGRDQLALEVELGEREQHRELGRGETETGGVSFLQALSRRAAVRARGRAGRSARAAPSGGRGHPRARALRRRRSRARWSAPRCRRARARRPRRSSTRGADPVRLRRAGRRRSRRAAGS